MDFENSNKLYELAARDTALAEALENLYRSYSGRMHTYILGLAHKYGVSLEADCFDCGSDPEQNFRKMSRLSVAGLILNKKPKEMQRFREFGRRLDEVYASEKIALAKAHGIELSRAEAEALSLWTGIL